MHMRTKDDTLCDRLLLPSFKHMNGCYCDVDADDIAVSKYGSIAFV